MHSLLSSQARTLVKNAGDDRLEADRQDVVSENLALASNTLPCQPKKLDELGYLFATRSAGGDNRSSLGLAVGDRPGIMRAEQRIELLL